MPLWKMEQITPYFEKEGSHTTHNVIGTKLVKDFLTNSEIGIIHSLPPGHSYNEEKITVPTVIAHTITTLSPIHRDENVDMNSYETAAKELYKVYWHNLSFWGRLHRVAHMWSLPAIAVSAAGLLVETLLNGAGN